jgi:hypothetical protein
MKILNNEPQDILIGTKWFNPVTNKSMIFNGKKWEEVDKKNED